MVNDVLQISIAYHVPWDGKEAGFEMTSVDATGRNTYACKNIAPELVRDLMLALAEIREECTLISSNKRS